MNDSSEFYTVECNGVCTSVQAPSYQDAVSAALGELKSVDFFGSSWLGHVYVATKLDDTKDMVIVWYRWHKTKKRKETK